MESTSGVLVTGGDGQVGRALRRHLPDARFSSRAELDVRDRAAVTTACERADVVIHLAALTDVDGCERQPDLARSINTDGTRNIAEVAAERGARVIYVSTDYVFDGTKAGEYSETDRPRPVNVYGTTKLAGEAYVAEGRDNLIVRTSWVFGEGPNFVATIRALGRERSEIAVVDDQRGRPTAAAGLASVIAALLDTTATGIVHAPGAGPACTWASLAQRVVELDGLPAKIQRVTTDEYAAIAPQTAPRPPNSTLSLDLLTHGLGIEMPGWETSLAAYLGVAA